MTLTALTAMYGILFPLHVLFPIKEKSVESFFHFSSTVIDGHFQPRDVKNF
jgi:hypothetical protein